MHRIYGTSNLVSISVCVRVLFNKVFFDDTFVRLFIFDLVSAFIKRIIFSVWNEMYVRMAYTVRGLRIFMHWFGCNQIWIPSGNYLKKRWNIFNSVTHHIVSTGRYWNVNTMNLMLQPIPDSERINNNIKGCNYI